MEYFGATGTHVFVSSSQLQPRPKTVSDIYNTLMQPGRTTIVLTGEEGIGKSKLAELLKTYAELQRQQGARLAGKTYMKTIHRLDTFLSLATDMLAEFELPQPDFQYFEPEEQVQTLLNALFEMPGDPPRNPARLIILDDFDRFLNPQNGEILPEHQLVAQWLVKLNENPCDCRILLVSRVFPKLSAAVPQIGLKEYPAPGFTEEEGIRMLKARALSDSDKELKKAVGLCRGHGLLLELLAKFVTLRKTPLATLREERDYLQIWSGSAKETAYRLLDHIYARLSEGQKQSLRALAIYRGPVKVEALNALAQGDAILRALLEMKENVLQYLLESVGDGEYCLPSLISQYCRNQLEGSGQQVLLQAHLQAAGYYVQQIQRLPPRGQRTRVSDVYPVIEAFWHYCQAHQWRIAFDLIQVQGLFPDLGNWKEDELLLELCALLMPVGRWQASPAEEAYIFRVQGRICSNQGDQQQAIKDLRHAIEVYEKSPHIEKDMAGVLLNLAQALQQSGEVEQAKDCLEQALPLLNASDYRLRGVTRRLQAICELEMGEFEQAREHIDEALACFQLGGISDYREEALTNIESGKVNCLLGDLNMALERYDRARKLYADNRDQRGEAMALNKMGEIFCKQNNGTQALSCHQRAYDLYRNVLELSGMAESRNGCGSAYFNQGDVGAARKQYEEARALYERRSNTSGMAESLIYLGTVSDAEGKLEEALQSCQRAYDILTKKQDRRKEGWALHNLAYLYAKQGKNDRALQYYKLALTAQEQAGDLQALGLTLFYFGQFYKKTGETLQAQGRKQNGEEAFRQAFDCFKSTLPIQRRLRNRGLEVVSLIETSAVKINLDNDAVGLAFLLYAEEADAAHCGSQYKRYIDTIRDSLIQRKGDEDFKQTLDEIHDGYHDIVENELR